MVLFCRGVCMYIFRWFCSTADVLESKGMFARDQNFCNRTVCVILLVLFYMFLCLHYSSHGL